MMSRSMSLSERASPRARDPNRIILIGSPTAQIRATISRNSASVTGGYVCGYWTIIYAFRNKHDPARRPFRRNYRRPAPCSAIIRQRPRVGQVPVPKRSGEGRIAEGRVQHCQQRRVGGVAPAALLQQGEERLLQVGDAAPERNVHCRRRRRMTETYRQDRNHRNVTKRDVIRSTTADAAYRDEAINARDDVITIDPDTQVDGSRPIQKT